MLRDKPESGWLSICGSPGRRTSEQRRTRMATDQYRPVRVSRRIEAPPEVVFGIITDPRQHLALDGSGMLRGAVTTEPVTGVGDVFVMKMYFVRLGDYEMNNH